MQEDEHGNLVLGAEQRSCHATRRLLGNFPGALPITWLGSASYLRMDTSTQLVEYFTRADTSDHPLLGSVAAKLRAAAAAAQRGCVRPWPAALSRAPPPSRQSLVLCSAGLAAPPCLKPPSQRCQIVMRWPLGMASPSQWSVRERYKRHSAKQVGAGAAEGDAACSPLAPPPPLPMSGEAHAFTTTCSPAAAANAGGGGGSARLLPGVEVVDGRAIVRLDTPTYDVLASASNYNKKGRGAKKLKPELTANVGQHMEAVGVAALWAALRHAGGLHSVSCGRAAVLACVGAVRCGGLPLLSAHVACTAAQVRALGWNRPGGLLEVVQGMQGYAHFPATRAFVTALQGRIDTWLVPIYGWTPAEEAAGRRALGAGGGVQGGEHAAASS